jgi:hypothetical protein
MNAISLPTIRRARGWRLYGLDGARYLDLYSEGGKTILGRKNAGMGSLAKACIDSGLVSEFPSVWTARLVKAIRAWLPAYDKVFFFPTAAEARAALASALGSRPAADMRTEKAFGEYLRNSSEDDSSAKSGEPALAELPLPALWSFGIILVSGSGDTSLNEKLKTLAGPDRVPAIKMALAVKALAELSAFSTSYNEKLWLRMDPYIDGLFSRSGPWLYPAYAESSHARVFQECLEKGILISPEFSRPSLVPGEFDSGELSCLRTIAANAKEA